MADSEEVTRLPFTVSGECLDEITFLFDDEKELYVSQNFLRYVSPVFTAMFEHEFTEQQTRIVKLKGKCYDDFLDFLLCLHPDQQKPIDKYNMLRIVSLAEEYQARLIIQRCKTAMTESLESEVAMARKTTEMIDRLRAVRACLKILTTAHVYEYEEVVKRTCKTIGQFGHAVFTGTVPEYKAYPDMFKCGRLVSSKPDHEDPLED